MLTLIIRELFNHKANDVGERVLSRLQGYVSKADSI